MTARRKTKQNTLHYIFLCLSHTLIVGVLGKRIQMSVSDTSSCIMGLEPLCIASSAAQRL